MCDYEDMRDTETQSTAGQSEEEREGVRENGSNIQAICTRRYSSNTK